MVGERLEHDIDIIQQICDLYEIFFKKQERRFDEEGNKIGFEWEIQFFELFLKHRSVLVYPLQSAMRFYESYAEILMKEFGENFQDKWLSYLQTFASHLTLDVKEYDDLMNEISALKNESSQKETDEDAPERSELIQKYSLFARYIRDNLGTNLTMTKKLIDNYHWWLENDFKDYNYEKLEKFISEKNILN